MLAAIVARCLWSYAVAYVVETTNMFPTRATDMKTSAYVMVHKHAPDVARRRTFRCDANVHLPLFVFLLPLLLSVPPLLLYHLFMWYPILA